MDLNLKGKVALITGASRGIGRAVAEALGAEGCDLVLTSRTARDLDAVKASIEKQNKVTVRTVAADLSDSVTVGRLTNDFPAIDILINNAGAIPGGQLAEIDETRWRVAWDLKVFGTINMTRAFYPLIKARGGGVIINVIGNAALTRDPEYICGATANAGLTAFTESLGSTSLRDGIRVNAVSPGPTATDRLVETREQEGAGAARRSQALAGAVHLRAWRPHRRAGRDRIDGCVPRVAEIQLHQRSSDYARCRRVVAWRIILTAWRFPRCCAVHRRSGCRARAQSKA